MKRYVGIVVLTVFLMASLSGLASAMGRNPLEWAYVGQIERSANAGLGNDSAGVLAGVLANVQNLTGRGWNESELACRGIEDLSRILGENSDRLSNLDGDAERYEFWKEQGIYDDYTARERAYLNNAVLPGILPGIVSRGKEAVASASMAGLGMLSAALRVVAPGLADALATFQVKNQFPGYFDGGRSGGAGAERGWSEDEEDRTDRLRGLILAEIAEARKNGGPPWSPPRMDFTEPPREPTPIPGPEDPEGNGRDSLSRGHSGKGSYSTHIRLTK